MKKIISTIIIIASFVGAVVLVAGDLVTVYNSGNIFLGFSNNGSGTYDTYQWTSATRTTPEPEDFTGTQTVEQASNQISSYSASYLQDYYKSESDLDWYGGGE